MAAAARWAGERRARVVVIGSGASGLMCARTLADRFGVTNVVVLEAADYVGGRIKQDHTFMKGKEVEVGAEFLHGDSTLLSDLATKYNLRLWPLCTWAQGDGGPLDEAAPDGGKAYYWIGDGGDGRRRGRLTTMHDLPPDMEHLHQVLTALLDMDPELAAKDRRTVAQYLADQGVTPRMLDMACAGYSNTAGNASHVLGVAQMVATELMYDKDGDHDSRMEPSYRVLVDQLKRGLDITTDCPARKVEVTAGAAGEQVVVTCADGRVVRAEVAVVTPSVAILRDGDITFCPALQPHKVRALNSLEFSDGVKVLLKFDSQPWPSDCHGIICSHSFLPEMWMNQTSSPVAAARTSGDLPKQEYMVTGFAMGTRCDALRKMTDEAVIAHTLAQLDRMFGPTRPAGARSACDSFLAGAVHYWGDAPFVRGAYTCPGIREPLGARAAVAEPHCKRVLFAGEACLGATPLEDSPSTLHGSMVTGRQAAEAAAKLLGAREHHRVAMRSKL